MRIYSHGMFISVIAIQGFLIDPNLINNVKSKQVLLVNYYFHNEQATYFGASIYSYTGVTITDNNAFFGLRYFKNNLNKVGYQLNVTNSQIYLYK